ncbi:MAG TPA: hypothetical protein VM075_05685 [Anaerolineae bacterium]|nr:hypothetical protein [Anaerolineae bacterium]
MSVFSVHSGSADVEAVMGVLGDALRRWEGGEARPLDLSLLQGQVDRLTEGARQLTLQWNIDGNAIIHSTRRRGAWLIRFQIVVRRLTWWFLEPILQQIRLFQMNTAHVADGLAQNQEALMQQLRDVPQEEWKSRLEALEAQVAELRRQASASNEKTG